MTVKKSDAVKQPRNSKPKKKATPGSWPKGRSGNPAGRPRSGCAIAQIWRDYLGEDAGDGRSRKERMIQRLYKIVDCETPSVAAAKLIVEIVDNADIMERLLALEIKLGIVTTEGRRTS
jgi:hypothetical protein